jgi:hypothetical protein
LPGRLSRLGVRRHEVPVSCASGPEAPTDICSSPTSVHGGKAAARDLAPVFEKAVDVEEVGVALGDALRGTDRFEQAPQTGSDVGAGSTATSGFRQAARHVTSVAEPYRGLGRCRGSRSRLGGLGGFSTDGRTRFLDEPLQDSEVVRGSTGKRTEELSKRKRRIRGPPLSREAGLVSLPLRQLGGLGRSATVRTACPAITRVATLRAPSTPSSPLDLTPRVARILPLS